jgi:hypothetical protein
VPNYYASTPLVAAKLDPLNAIFVPAQDKPRFLKRSVVMSGSASATSNTNQNQALMLLDYLLYYPFVDLDAAGEEQVMDNTVVLDRYTDGIGVQIMVVAQAPTVGSGNYTVKFIDTDDIEHTTAVIVCPVAQPSGARPPSVCDGFLLIKGLGCSVSERVVCYPSLRLLNKRKSSSQTYLFTDRPHRGNRLLARADRRYAKGSISIIVKHHRRTLQRNNYESV